MNNVKILCIAGSIVLGSILLSGQAFGKAPSDLITLSAPKEPEGQHVSYDIDGSGSYYDSESDTTYYFVKGIVTSYSNHTKTFSLTSDVGETYELPADTDINITDYLNTEAHIWYSEDSQKNLKLLAFSPQIFWEHINELESDEQIPDGATEIDGTLSKYISFWLREDKIDVTLLFVEDNDGNTHIYAEDNTCNNCNSSVFGKTIGDYIKLYEDMHLNSQVYDDFNVAYLISEASS